MNIRLDAPLLGLARARRKQLLALLPQDELGFFEVAVGLLQGLLAIENADARLLAELFHQLVE
jgi:hypothetical protein